VRGCRAQWEDGGSDGLERQPHSRAPLNSGCSSITHHEGLWERLLELVLSADYVNGSLVLFTCLCMIKRGLGFFGGVLHDKGDWEK